jgi:hypothetical protein
MSGDDWQAGDLALCVRGGYISGPPGPSPVAGAVYSVTGVTMENFWESDGSDTEDVALWFEDAPPNERGDKCWWAGRFRKIRPHTPDAEDIETIALLTGKPVREPVA